MRFVALSFFLFVVPLLPSVVGDKLSLTSSSLVTQAGIFFPRVYSGEASSAKPKSLKIRVVNQGETPLFLQGMKHLGESDDKIELFFYHQKHRRKSNNVGWKPYFETQPCNLPTCRNLRSGGSSCGRTVPYVVRLGPVGTPTASREFEWSGFFYERSEATRELSPNRYCYKGWAPVNGRVRVEVSYSDSVQRDADHYEVIGGRDMRAIEFNLPAQKQRYTLALGR